MPRSQEAVFNELDCILKALPQSEALRVLLLVHELADLKAQKLFDLATRAPPA